MAYITDFGISLYNFRLHQERLHFGSSWYIDKFGTKFRRLREGLHFGFIDAAYNLGNIAIDWNCRPTEDFADDQMAYHWNPSYPSTSTTTTLWGQLIIENEHQLFEDIVRW